MLLSLSKNQKSEHGPPEGLVKRLCTEHGAHYTSLITRAGEPTAIAAAGTSFVTTEPAPTTALSPMVTPGRITEPEPIQAFLPM